MQEYVNKYELNFWRNFDREKITMQPSSFSRFCLAYIPPGESLLDVCCGNRRDTIFFEDSSLEVHSFDLEEVNLEDKKDRFSLDKTFDHIYCRFVLHAVREDLEDYILINSNRVLTDGGLLFIETRSDKGEVPDGDHYRRLVNKGELIRKLTNLNFEILYEMESEGLSVYNGEDPVLIRLVACKKGPIEIGDSRGFNRWYEKNLFNVIVDGRHTKVINPEVAEYLLLKVKRVLDVYKVPFLLVFGTLLGAYRDNKFIEYDRDMDIAFIQGYREKVRGLITAGWFAVYGIRWIRDVDYLYSLAYEGEYIDFYFFKRRPRGYICGGADEYVIKKSQIDNPNSKIMFLGEEFSTVSNIEQYLENQYGETWRIPIR